MGKGKEKGEGKGERGKEKGKGFPDVSFSRWTVLFTARCVYFMSPKVNCAIYSAWLVCVCVPAYDLGWIAANFGEFFCVDYVIYRSLCAFYVSQSELRHLHCMVCVCVRVGIWSRNIGWIVLFRWVLPGEPCCLQLAVCICCLPK